MLNQTAVDALYSATYVEDYQDSVENLPDDLQKHITRLREMDLSIQSYFREVSGSMSRLLELLRDSETKPNQLELSRLQTRIQTLLMTCQELGDEKIHVGQQIQELIENKNRQLDLDRKNLESACRVPSSGTETKDPPAPPYPREERKRAPRRIRHETFIPSVLGPSTLVATSYNAEGKGEPIVLEPMLQPPKQSNASTPLSIPTPQHHQKEKVKDIEKVTGNLALTQIASSTATTTTGLPFSSTKEKSGSNTDPSTSAVPGPTIVMSTPKKGEKRGNDQTQAQKRTRRRRRSSTKQTEKQINIPVDPDEPTYCLCVQVSYGEMIGCDNDLCPIEWFHFSCVSLTTKPKGKWYCPKCRGDRPNVMKPKNIFLKELEKYNKDKEEKS